MKNQLLTEELTPTEAKIITESSADGKTAWMSGIFMQADIKNRNNRVYPLSEITEAVASANRMITERNGILGELDHPQSLSINLDRVSHMITEMHMDGNNAIGKAKMLNTPMGNIASELIRSGVSLGVSSRGAGTVNESAGTVSGFILTTVDVVAMPSAMDAYPSTVFESLESAQNGKVILDLAESVKHDDAAQKYLKKEILAWLSTGLFAKK